MPTPGYRCPVPDSSRIPGTFEITSFTVEADSDISGYVKTGVNELEIKVTNLWVNRLIGDCHPDRKETITYTGFRHYKNGDPLLPSGLIGPVRFLSKTENQKSNGSPL